MEPRIINVVFTSASVRGDSVLAHHIEAAQVMAVKRCLMAGIPVTDPVILDVKRSARLSVLQLAGRTVDPYEKVDSLITKRVAELKG